MAIGMVQTLLDMIGVGGGLAIAVLLGVVAWQGRHIMMVVQSLGLYLRLGVIATVLFALAIAIGVINPGAINLEPVRDLANGLMEVAQ